MMHEHERHDLPTATEQSIRDWLHNWHMGVAQNVTVLIAMGQVDALLTELTEKRLAYAELDRDFREYREIASGHRITTGGA